MNRKILISVIVGISLIGSILIYLFAVSETGNQEPELVCEVNFLEGFIYAVGKGILPAEAASPRQAELLAKKAAMDNAYQRLLEEVWFSDLVSQYARVTSFQDIEDGYRVTGWISMAEIVDLQKRDGWLKITIRIPFNPQQSLPSGRSLSRFDFLSFFDPSL